MHPAEEIFCEKSNKLRGKTIIIGITGSVAASECFATIREMIRHGATVIPVMSPESRKMVTPEMMEFASGNKAILELTGQAEHVSLLGEGKPADMFLVYPATANTISKIGCGIDDTAVTSMATVALGSGMPIAVVPAMHHSMYVNPAVQENIDKLMRWGVRFIGPHSDGVRAKVSSREEVVAHVIREMSKDDLRGKRVLVIGGRSEEPIDSMRMITNRSTGLMAMNIAERAFERGADTELWMGGSSLSIPDYIVTRRFETVAELSDMVVHVKHDIVIVPAALADFATKDPINGKIPSGKKATITLDPVKKVLPLIRKKCKNVIGFKAESGLDRDALITKARSRLDEYDLKAIVANDIDVAGKHSAKVILVTRDNDRDISGTKADIADEILDYCAGIL